MEQAPPNDLKLIIEFINSVDLENTASDRLASGAALGTWLHDHGLEAGRTPPSDEAALHARELREALREMALAHAEGKSSAAWPPWCEAVPFRLVGSGADLDLRGAPGAEPGVGEVLAAVYRSQLQGTWARLKACRKHSCRWAFYDASKNRSGTWCNMAVCGNRVKAQRRRQRARASA